MYVCIIGWCFYVYFSECRDGIRCILTDPTHKKMSRDNALRALLATASVKLSHPQEDSVSPPLPPPSSPSLISSSFWTLCGQQLQSLALESGLRLEVYTAVYGRPLHLHS